MGPWTTSTLLDIKVPDISPQSCILGPERWHAAGAPGGCYSWCPAMGGQPPSHELDAAIDEPCIIAAAAAAAHCSCGASTGLWEPWTGGSAWTWAAASPIDSQVPYHLALHACTQSCANWLFLHRHWSVPWSIRMEGDDLCTMCIDAFHSASDAWGHACMRISDGLHVTVCAIQSRILRGPSIKIKSLLDPLHVLLLVLLLEVVSLWNWAVLIWTVRIKKAVTCVEISNVSPLNCLLLWIWTVSWICWNWLISLEAPRVLDHLEVPFPCSHVHASLEVLDADLLYHW